MDGEQFAADCVEDVGGEEGEILSSSMDADSGFVPLAGPAETGADYSDEEEDEAPDEILNKVAQATVEVKVEEVIDPALCRICRKNPHKYRCPKCEVRSCSLDCSKKHKEANMCDGVRGPFAPVAKLSQYDAGKSVQDQNWMAGIQDKMYQQPTQVAAVTQMRQPVAEPVKMESSDSFGGQNEEPSFSDEQSQELAEGGEEQQPPRQFPVIINEDGTRNSANSAVERFLLPNAHRRRIWLSYSQEKDGTTDLSRHEQFSDSIFWCIDFIFTKVMEDGKLDEYTHRVQNIPETIRLCTVLKQFLKPRKYGCIVSQSDLDMEKMKPFIEAGPDGLSLFMRVPRYEKERYYVVNPEKNMLDNTRNRVIVDHPKVIVHLGNQCANLQTMSEDEAEELRGRLQKERYSQQNQMNRGRGGMSRGFRGGGFRGGPRGGGDFGGGFRGRGGFSRGGGYQKRPYNGAPGGGQDFKRGRGRGGYRGGRNNADLDTFDPFEPFKGKQRLPADYGQQKETPAEVASWANAISVRPESSPFETSTAVPYVAPSV